MSEQNFVVECPHCKEPVLIEQVNCAIFRHGVQKDNFQQIGPHASKEECVNFINNNLIYGCGKPFKLEKNYDNKENNYVAVICDYI